MQHFSFGLTRRGITKRFGANSKTCLLAGLCMLATSTVGIASETDHAAPKGKTYKIIDLGALSPEGSSAAFSISDTQTIVGRTFGGPTSSDAVYWQGTTLYDLGAPPSGSVGEANFSNNFGQIVGDYFFRDTFNSVPFWVRGPGAAPQILPSLALPYARPSGINDWGLIAGTAEIESDDPNDNLGGTRVVVWLGGEIRDLGTLGGPSAISDEPGNVNDFGVVVGGSDISSTEVNPNLGGYTFHATLWTGTTGHHPVAHDMGTLAKQKDNQVSLAYSINNLGQVVGWSFTDVPDTCFGGPQQWGFVWQDDRMRGLPPLDGDCDAEATMSNIFGTIVGESYGAADDGSQVTRAVLWKGGKTVDLTSLLPPNSGWQLIFVTGINDLGEIVGTGINPQGQVRAFLMKP